MPETQDKSEPPARTMYNVKVLVDGEPITAELVEAETAWEAALVVAARCYGECEAEVERFG